MFSDPSNTRRATPERVLWIFTAFVGLAALSAVRDCQGRTRMERAVSVSEGQPVP